MFCRASLPIAWSASDTDDTIRQAKAHNAVGKTLNCAAINPAWKR